MKKLAFITTFILAAITLAWASNDVPTVQVSVESNRISIYSFTTDSVTTQRPVFPKGSTLTVSHEVSEKIARVYVSIDNAPEEVYYEPVKLMAKGRHQVKIRAVNHAGKESVVEFSFLVVETGF